MIWQWLFDTLWGWLGGAVVICIVALVVGYVFPELRKYCIVAIGVALSAASLVAKGHRDRKRIEEERRDKAVEKANEEFRKIDERNTDANDARKRLRDGSF